MTSMVDERYNITGIIDWSGVSTVPREAFAAVPGFRKSPNMKGESAAAGYRSRLNLFLELLRKREKLVGDRVEPLLLSEFVGSNLAECLMKALERGMPWRGIA